MDDQNPRVGSDEARLDGLFMAYREACPDREPGADFMPQLWQKIEARDRVSTVFGRLARNLVTAALALSVLLGLAVSLSSHVAPLPSQSYVEVLAEDHARQNLDYFEPAEIVPAADQR
ncbi:MAG TPA: hypothetical protein VFO27_06145 [Bryobacteraceae bacterium]|nr:hypothetical protein [Bryobacteraceae bacterium]